MKFKALILYSSVLMGRWGREKREKEVTVSPHSTLGADVKVSIRQPWFGTCTGMDILGFPDAVSGFYSKSLHFVHLRFCTSANLPERKIKRVITYMGPFS